MLKTIGSPEPPPVAVGVYVLSPTLVCEDVADEVNVMVCVP